jgi:hypothetical protein
MSDLTELFSRDPNSYTKEDIKSIITIYREKRKQFNAGALQAGKAKTPTTKSQSLAAAIKSDDIDL